MIGLVVCLLVSSCGSRGDESADLPVPTTAWPTLSGVEVTSAKPFRNESGQYLRVKVRLDGQTGEQLRLMLIRDLVQHG